MDARTSQAQFADELDRLVHRYRLEGALTYHEVIGVLELKKQVLVLELVNQANAKNPDPE
jgi:hypothetical protein